jgi:hypothetical protein
MLLSVVVGNVYGFNYTHEKLLRLNKVLVASKQVRTLFLKIL